MIRENSSKRTRTFFLDGPLRIHVPIAQVGGGIRAEDTPLAEPATTKGDDYLKRLVLLIPSEVIALYLTFKEVVSSWLGVWSFICLLLVLFVRTVGTWQEGRPVQWVAVLAASVSFILWIYATGGNLLGIAIPTEMPGVISVAVGVWTFLIPYFYKGD